MPATFRCYQLKRSKDGRKRCINLMTPKYSVIVAENKGFSSRYYLGLFLVDLGLFCHFMPGLALSRLVPSLLWSLGQREQAWVRGWDWKQIKHNFKSDGAILSLQRRCYGVCRWMSISWHRRWSNCKQTERWLQDAKTETYWPEAVSRMSFLQCKEHFICERDDF